MHCTLPHALTLPAQPRSSVLQSSVGCETSPSSPPTPFFHLYFNKMETGYIIYQAAELYKILL